MFEVFGYTSFKTQFKRWVLDFSNQIGVLNSFNVGRIEYLIEDFLNKANEETLFDLCYTFIIDERKLI